MISVKTVRCLRCLAQDKLNLIFYTIKKDSYLQAVTIIHQTYRTNYFAHFQISEIIKILQSVDNILTIIK